MRRLITAAAFALSALALAAASAEDRVDPLPVEQAFRAAVVADGSEVVAVFTMPRDIYLYRDKLALTTATPGFTVAALRAPAGEVLDDPFFGRTTVYFDGVTLRADVQSEGGGKFDLIALYQGCDKQIGICYPPQALTVALAVGGASLADASVAEESSGKDEASRLAQLLSQNNLLFIIAAFFLLGVGLSLTPCVLPMLPILFGVISGDGKSRRQVITLTFAYIAGAVFAFTVFGVLAGLSGQLLSAALQTPIILVTFAAILVLLAVAMFAGWQIQTPAFVRNRLARVGGGGIFGAMLMGVVASIIVSPCVAPPLIGALLYISSTGDAAVGAAALMSLSLGMSLLLAVAGVVGAQALPKAGEWMSGVSRFFAVLLLLTAVWVASPLLPPPAQLVLYGGLLVFGGMLASPFAAPGAGAALGRYLVKAAALVMVLWGSAMLVGAAAGSRDVLTPLSFLGEDKLSASGGEALHFESVDSIAELERAVADAASVRQPVMLEFYADWCVTCKEFERFTLGDARVVQKLSAAKLLRVDVTANTESHRALLKHFGLFGPPAILFYDRDGELIKNIRIIGFEPPGEFLQTLTLANI